MDWINELSVKLSELNFISVFLRICLAMLCGGVLGIERGKSNQPAGMRTHVLVTLGAALVMLTGQYMFQFFGSGDPARLGAQVISGIGFLGAGSIIVEGRTRIRGLTTAAGLWTAACIGLAIGVGFYLGGLLVTGAVFYVISKSKTISDHFTHNDLWLRIYVEFDGIKRLNEIRFAVESFGMQVGNVMLNDPLNTGQYNAIISMKNPENKSERVLSEYLEKISGVKKISVID